LTSFDQPSQVSSSRGRSSTEVNLDPVQWAKHDGHYDNALQAYRTANLLVARFDLRGNQTDFVHTGGVG
jgi:hypothetical protein